MRLCLASCRGRIRWVIAHATATAAREISRSLVACYWRPSMFHESLTPLEMIHESSLSSFPTYLEIIAPVIDIVGDAIAQLMLDSSPLEFIHGSMAPSVSLRNSLPKHSLLPTLPLRLRYQLNLMFRCSTLGCTQFSL